MKRFFTFLVAFILCATAICFQSCSDSKYTVWTDTGTYAEFQTSFNATLEDGYYKKMEITNEQWKQIAPNLTNEGKTSLERSRDKKMAYWMWLW